MTIISAQAHRAMDEAAGWLARLQRDDVAEADGLAFEAWLAPENFDEGGRQRQSLSAMRAATNP